MTASTTESNGLEQNFEKRWLLTEGSLEQSHPKRREIITASQMQSGQRPGRFWPHPLNSMKIDAHIFQARTGASLIKEDFFFLTKFYYLCKDKNDCGGVKSHLQVSAGSNQQTQIKCKRFSCR